MLRKEQIEYALHYAEDPAEWVFELVRGLEKRIDELVKYGTKVTVFQEHWHPASELPPKSTRIIVCYKDKHSYDLYTSQPSFLTKDNEYIGVPEYAQKTLMWCYPPKED